MPENAYEIENRHLDSSLIVSCDHASNRVPEEVEGGCLGVSDEDMSRHIAYDVGAAGVSRHLGKLLNCPVILSRFSRLVIDPNRGENDPTLVMQLYDGTIIPGNRTVSDDDLLWRLNNCYYPYHNALAELLAERRAPMLISVHSFTAQINGFAKRPWHVGILHENDIRLARPLLEILRSDDTLCVGENEPYGGHLAGDSIDKHALASGRPNVLIEIRNDLIRTEQQQLDWAERLAPVIQQAANNPTD